VRAETDARWALTRRELSRAYRKASLGVHPDKNPAPEARRAFDALKEAHKLLQDGASRREYEQQEGEKLLQKVAAERPEELVRMKRAREAQEAAAFADDVRAQAARQAERCVLPMSDGSIGLLLLSCELPAMTSPPHTHP
jgi:DnaJ-class molecular chaperone